jgi:hypothetical protein
MSVLKSNKAICIIRVSSLRQEDGCSYELQNEMMKEYAKENKLSIEREFRFAESAKDSAKRIKYRNAISWALEQRIVHILFYMADRETRNLSDNEENEVLVRRGLLQLHYVRDGKVLHKDSPNSDFLSRDMQAIINKSFSWNLSSKVIDATTRKAEDGWLPSNHVPLGYKHQKLKDSSGRELKNPPARSAGRLRT